MNVIPAKPSQFSPVILYLPGYEPPGNRRLQKEGKGRASFGLTVTSTNETELWKIYRRLTETTKPVKTSKCGIAPSAVNIPGKGGMKCMCYENLMKLVKDQATIDPPQLYRFSTNKMPHRKFDSIFPTWTKRALLGFRCNEELQFPLSTLIVRWQLKRTLPSYDQNALEHIFAKYGNLRDIRQMSPNSCVVVFDELEPACHVMQSRNVGDPTNKLHCKWWHQSMANKTICSTAKGIQVKTDFYKL